MNESWWYAARAIKTESALKFVSYIKIWTVLMWFMWEQVNAGNRNATQMGCNLATKWHILVVIDWELSPTVESFDLVPRTPAGLRCCFAHSQHYREWIKPLFSFYCRISHDVEKHSRLIFCTVITLQWSPLNIKSKDSAPGSNPGERRVNIRAVHWEEWELNLGHSGCEVAVLTTESLCHLQLKLL